MGCYTLFFHRTPPKLADVMLLASFSAVELNYSNHHPRKYILLKIYPWTHPLLDQMYQILVNLILIYICIYAYTYPHLSARTLIKIAKFVPVYWINVCGTFGSKGAVFEQLIKVSRACVLSRGKPRPLPVRAAELWVANSLQTECLRSPTPVWKRSAVSVGQT